MLPNLRSHKKYIKFADRSIQKIQIPKAHDDILPKLKLLDLTPLRFLFMPLCSSGFGRSSFAPEDMTRAFIVMTLCGVSSALLPCYRAIPSKRSSAVFSVFSDNIFLSTSLNSGYSFLIRSRLSLVSMNTSQ